MSGFDERGQAHEKKEALSAEKQFKMRARRNRALGVWAAELMGYDEAGTEAYIKEVIASDFEEVSDDDVHRKVHKDLNDAGKMVTEQELRARMDAMLGEARQSVSEEEA